MMAKKKFTLPTERQYSRIREASTAWHREPYESEVGTRKNIQPEFGGQIVACLMESMDLVRSPTVTATILRGSQYPVIDLIADCKYAPGRTFDMMVAGEKITIKTDSTGEELYEQISKILPDAHVYLGSDEGMHPFRWLIELSDESRDPQLPSPISTVTPEGSIDQHTVLGYTAMTRMIDTGELVELTPLYAQPIWHPHRYNSGHNALYAGTIVTAQFVDGVGYMITGMEPEPPELAAVTINDDMSAGRHDQAAYGLARLTDLNDQIIKIAVYSPDWELDETTHIRVRRINGEWVVVYADCDAGE
jgi:hypothetical protein